MSLAALGVCELYSPWVTSRNGNKLCEVVMLIVINYKLALEPVQEGGDVGYRPDNLKSLQKVW
jgi:hypothetical protein